MWGSATKSISRRRSSHGVAIGKVADSAQRGRKERKQAAQLVDKNGIPLLPQRDLNAQIGLFYERGNLRCSLGMFFERDHEELSFERSFSDELSVSIFSFFLECDIPRPFLSA